MWGRLVEAAVGAHLVNSSFGKNYEVYYWRERDREVDYVLRSGHSLVGIEVKTGRAAKALSGMTSFKKKFSPIRTLLVGLGGMPVEEFLEHDVSRFFRS